MEFESTLVLQVLQEELKKIQDENFYLKCVVATLKKELEEIKKEDNE